MLPGLLVTSPHAAGRANAGILPGSCIVLHCDWAQKAWPHEQISGLARAVGESVREVEYLVKATGHPEKRPLHIQNYCFQLQPKRWKQMLISYLRNLEILLAKLQKSQTNMEDTTA